MHTNRPVVEFRGKTGACAALALCLLLSGSAPAAPGEAEAGPSDQAWLGVWLSDAVDGGVQILAVVGGGPAATAGVRPGDLIVEAAGRSVSGEEELGRLLRALAPGERLSVALLRSGERVETAILLGRRTERATVWSVVPAAPSVPARPAEPAPLLPGIRGERSLGQTGIQVTEITPALRAHYGAPEGHGVLITRVEPETPAARAGLRVGDVMVRVGEQPIRSESELRVNLLRCDTGRPCDIRVIRGKQPLGLTLSPARAEEDLARAAVAERTAHREAMARRMQEEVERLERRVEELRRELRRLRESDD